MKLTIAIAALSLLAIPSAALQLKQIWSFKDLQIRSDVVVIAQWVSTKDTGERTQHPEMKSLPVIVLNTTLTPLLVLKGSLSEGSLMLRHYRLDTNRMSGGCLQCGGSLEFRFYTRSAPARSEGGPGQFVDDPPGRYLLFLIRDKDGAYIPTSGQTFPADSVVALVNAN